MPSGLERLPGVTQAALWPVDPPPGRAAAEQQGLAVCTEGRWQQDAEGRLTWACAAMAQLCGAPMAELNGRTLAPWFGDEVSQRLAEAQAQSESTLRVSRPEPGAERWFELTLQLWRDDRGVCQGGRGVARDVTAVVLLEQRLQRSERSLLALVETASEGIAVVQDQVFRFVNRHLQTFLGIPAEQLLGRPFMDVIHPDDRPLLIENHRRRLAGLPVPPRYEFRLHTEERGVRWLEMSGSVVEWEGRPATLTHIADITARKALDEQVRQLAFQDTLTGLANRRLLEERLDQALDNGRHGQHHGALLFLDLDAFKPLNDTHGHAEGDQMLISVAQRLRQSVRATDVVARLGGDEFVVLLSPLAADRAQATADATQVADKLRRLLDPPHRLTPPGATTPLDCHCPASVGLTVFGPEDQDPQAVLQRADEAMYAVKAQRRAERGGAVR
jgi:diguanylate cyclase (GGDEF)-like protein/PAS domain S-box-containing protein